MRLIAGNGDRSHYPDGVRDEVDVGVEDERHDGLCLLAGRLPRGHVTSSFSFAGHLLRFSASCSSSLSLDQPRRAGSLLRHPE